MRNLFKVKILKEHNIKHHIDFRAESKQEIMMMMMMMTCLNN